MYSGMHLYPSSSEMISFFRPVNILKKSAWKTYCHIGVDYLSIVPCSIHESFISLMSIAMMMLAWVSLQRSLIRQNR